jgi:hypothetical protein
MEHAEVTLVFTVGGKNSVKAESLISDEGYGSSSPTSATMPMPSLPMTILEEGKSLAPPTPKETKRFRLPWGNGCVDQAKRREKEMEAEDMISSWSGRSLNIQLENVEKILNKEKRRVQFGLSSSRVMDLAIRRYSYKYILY